MAVAMEKTYTSNIIHAGALVADTRLLLAAWNTQESVPENLQRVVDENLLAKSSRARLKEELVVFKKRYLLDAELTAALVTLVQANIAGKTLHAILYYLTAEADPLIADSVTELFAAMLAEGKHDITTKAMTAWLLAAVRTGRTAGQWSASTAERIAHGVLATLRDFDIIAGKAKKRLQQPFLPVPAFAFIAFLLQREGQTGERLLTHPSWRRFLLNRREVEQHFLAAHQENVLNYQAAGRVVRIEFPVNTIKEYARVLVERAL